MYVQELIQLTVIDGQKQTKNECDNPNDLLVDFNPKIPTLQLINQTILHQENNNHIPKPQNQKKLN